MNPKVNFSGLYVTMRIINLKTDYHNSCITIFWNTNTPSVVKHNKD